MGGSEADRQSQLLDIARRQFARQGYAGTSLRDIADEAGITKAALYYYFPNKDALFLQIVQSGLTQLLNEVGSAVEAASAEPPIERIRIFMTATADYIERHRHVWLASSNTFWVALNPEGRKGVLVLRDRFESLLRDCVADGVRQGALRPDLDAAMAARMLLSIVNHFVRWYDPAGPKSAREILGSFVDMTITGLAAPAR